MFTLKNAIENWKRQLRRDPAFEDGDIAELESHLRDEIDRLKAEGLSEEKAFKLASDEIGNPRLIGHELYKSRATQMAGPDPPWHNSSGVFSLLPNYVKVALRSFKRNPAYSAINLISLSVAFAICLLVITFVKDQADYDTFHRNADRLFRVITTIPSTGGSSTSQFATSPYELAPILTNELPEIVHTSRLIPFSGAAVFDNKRLSVSGFRADSNFFKLFDFEFALGNAAKALYQPNSVVLSKDAAERFFGSSVSPLGKVLVLNNGQSYEVMGVLRPKTYRSHLEFDLLISTSGNRNSMMSRSVKTSWQDPSWYTYFMVNQGAVIDELDLKMQQIAAAYYPGEIPKGYHLRAQKVTEINLGKRLARQIGRITPPEFIYFLSALALVILLAACINYVNLTVARSMKRAREIGLRKVLGAGRRQLIFQILSESIITATVSLAVALLLFLGWLLPYWNSLRLATADFGRIAFDTANNPELYLIFLGFTFIVGFISGVYPAVKLSAHEPAHTLKGDGTSPGERGWPLRKALIVIQLSLSIVLLISTILLNRQSELLLNTDYGFNHKHVINVDLNEVSFQAFRDDAMRQAGVSGVSATSTLPGVEFPVKEWVHSQGVVDSISVSAYSVDSSFLNNFDIELVLGRNFSQEFATDTTRAILINESAVESLGFMLPANALGKYITKGNEDSQYQVIGIIEDFQFDFLWNPISPLILQNDPSNFRIASIKLVGDQHEGVLSDLEKIWQEYEPVAPFDYRYYSNQIENVYNDFRELVAIIGFLSVLAILISSFGMLAMAHFDTQTRIKEIGVRKVLGAHTGNLVWMLSYDFLKMIGFAAIVGVPLAIYLNRLWLQIFSTKVHFGNGVIIIALLITITLTITSICLETYKAAVMNPVHTLRSE